MQFQVPQFIEVEDKIIGPFTFKQFIYVIGGLGIAFVFFRYVPIIGYILAPLFAGAGFAFAFGQWNGRPFLVGLEAAFYYFITGHLYLWSSEKKQKLAQPRQVPVSNAQTPLNTPTLANSKLHTLAWSLDIQENLARAQTTQNAPPSLASEVQRSRAGFDTESVRAGGTLAQALPNTAPSAPTQNTEPRRLSLLEKMEQLQKEREATSQMSQSAVLGSTAAVTQAANFVGAVTSSPVYNIQSPSSSPASTAQPSINAMPQPIQSQNSAVPTVSPTPTPAVNPPLPQGPADIDSGPQLVRAERPTIEAGTPANFKKQFGFKV